MDWAFSHTAELENMETGEEQPAAYLDGSGSEC